MEKLKICKICITLNNLDKFYKKYIINISLNYYKKNSIKDIILIIKIFLILLII